MEPENRISPGLEQSRLRDAEHGNPPTVTPLRVSRGRRDSQSCGNLRINLRNSSADHRKGGGSGRRPAEAERGSPPSPWAALPVPIPCASVPPPPPGPSWGTFRARPAGLVPRRLPPWLGARRLPRPALTFPSVQGPVPPWKPASHARSLLFTQ